MLLWKNNFDNLIWEIKVFIEVLQSSNIAWKEQ